MQAPLRVCAARSKPCRSHDLGRDMARSFKAAAGVALAYLFSIGSSYAAGCEVDCVRKCSPCIRRYCAPPELVCYKACTTWKAQCIAVRASHRDQPFHGHYCGYGNTDPTYATPEMDALDGACKRHDKCWGRRGSLSCSCDKTLAAEAAALLLRKNTSTEVKEQAAIVSSFFASAPCLLP
jgi:hypothetical protein